MRKITRNPSRADVARSLRELEKLFGRKPPDGKDKGLREQAFGKTSQNDARFDRRIVTQKITGGAT